MNALQHNENRLNKSFLYSYRMQDGGPLNLVSWYSIKGEEKKVQKFCFT